MNENGWLKLTQITKRFGAVTALEGIDVTIRLGEVLALLGDNGAGKSTLVKIISGVYPPTSGEIHIREREVRMEDPRHARQLGVATIFQELALVDGLTVYENIFLGRELVQPRLGLPILNKRAMRSRVQQLITELGAHIPSPSAHVAELSGGQRQAVAIARALDLETELIIMDEPTAALAVAETRKVLGLIDRLRQAGKAILLVSHNLNDVMEIADRVLVLRRGRKVADCSKDSTNLDEIVSWITGAKGTSEHSLPQIS